MTLDQLFAVYGVLGVAVVAMVGFLFYINRDKKTDEKHHNA